MYVMFFNIWTRNYCFLFIMLRGRFFFKIRVGFKFSLELWYGNWPLWFMTCNKTVLLSAEMLQKRFLSYFLRQRWPSTKHLEFRSLVSSYKIHYSGTSKVCLLKCLKEVRYFPRLHSNLSPKTFNPISHLQWGCLYC